MEGADRRYDTEQLMIVSAGSESPSLSLPLVELKSNPSLQSDLTVNGKISHALGLEELMLLKWPYYPKQSTDLM